MQYFACSKHSCPCGNTECQTQQRDSILQGKIDIDTNVPSRPLRSSHAPRLAVLRTRTIFASRAFSVAESTVWNSLLDNVVNSDTLATFKTRLKTHLFRCVMWNVLATERLCISYFGVIQVLSLYCIVLYSVILFAILCSARWWLTMSEVPSGFVAAR